uniref:Uncharacterized protein n=1 Tax=uncultured marine group II/III euryarchaeote KM3_136_C10 TaxID=1457867 RepID=A0A075GF57_9EURY|nr:hypothetical protein [uncultured marine group II/III euryarchaeote KM3_136_C10]
MSESEKGPRAINIKINTEHLLKIEEDVDGQQKSVIGHFPICDTCDDAKDVERSDNGFGILNNYWCKSCEHEIDENGDCKTLNCSNCRKIDSLVSGDEWRTELRGSSGSHGHTDPTPLTPSPSIHSRTKCNECGSSNMKVRAGRMECQDCGSYQA